MAFERGLQELTADPTEPIDRDTSFHLMPPQGYGPLTGRGPMSQD